MTDVLTFATLLSPLTLALVQIVKKITPANGKWLPLFGMVIGILVGILWGYSMTDGQVVQYAWAGLISGLSAVGVYELGKPKQNGGNQ